MAESTSKFGNDNSTIPILEADIFGRITPEPQQTLEEVVGHDAFLMTGDDSVFYSEDEDTIQPGFSTNSNPELPSAEPDWSAKLWSTPSHSNGIEGSARHSGVTLEDAQTSLGSHSSPSTFQIMKEQTQTAYNEVIVNPTAAEGTRSSTSVEKKMENSPMLPMFMETERQERASAQEVENACLHSCDDGLKSGSPEGLEQGCESSTPTELDNAFGAQGDKLFNHLTYEKYGTVSYRQIRRGQTRRRIEEFESMMQL